MAAPIRCAVISAPPAAPASRRGAEHEVLVRRDNQAVAPSGQGQGRGQQPAAGTRSAHVQGQQHEPLADQHAADSRQDRVAAESRGETVANGSAEQAAERERHHEQAGIQGRAAQALLPQDRQGEEQAREAGEVQQCQELADRERPVMQQADLDNRLAAAPA
jgi:hypothetical protein